MFSLEAVVPAFAARFFIVSLPITGDWWAKNP
jgi:hypothetical protein